MGHGERSRSWSLAAALVCVLMIAVLWGGGLASMLPGMKILLNDEGLHGWAYSSLARDRLGAMVVQRVVCSSFKRLWVESVKDISGDWPMAVITISVSSKVSDPSIGTGLRLPLASGSPSFICRYSKWVTLPSSSPTTRTGAARKRNSTPSSSAASISTSLAGISPRVRR